jgi:GGDEF domain-containing protein
MLGLRPRVPFLKKRDPRREIVIEKATREAEAGRRLVMYDRETGLYAYWYLAQRFQEERQRTERYGHSLSVLVVELRQRGGFVSRDKMTACLLKRTRSSDLATHLGDGRYLVLLLETDAAAATVSAARLQAEFGDEVAVGLSSYPDDGIRLADLQSVAQERLSRPLGGPVA